jgi:glutamate/aspartate transport system permease protein
MLDACVFLQSTTDGSTVWALALLSGLGYTVALVLAAWLLAMGLGVLLGALRTTSRRWVVACGDAYVEVFRNVPLLVQFFLWYFVLPELLSPLKWLVRHASPTQFQFGVAVLCLGLFTAARVAEQVKAGIQALPRGQRLAAYAIGLTQAQAYRLVLLPLALRIVLPPLTSESMNLVKNSAVAYSIGLTELFLRTREMGETTFQYGAAFGAATLLYALLAFAINRALRRLERALAIPGLLGASR